MTAYEVAPFPAPDGRWTPEAFRDVYDAHVGAVHAVVVRTAWPSASEDVTQEVFMRLWRHPERYDPARGSLRTYLLTVARSIAVDLMRSEAARRVREERLAARRDTQSPFDADHDVLAAEVRSLVARALDALPEAEHRAIVTAFYGGCTYSEAAVVLGEPEGTVKSRIRSGLRRMNSRDAQLDRLAHDSL